MSLSSQSQAAYGQEFLSLHSLTHLPAIKASPWNASTQADDFLQQPSGPAPLDNNTILSQPDAQTSASNLKTAFYKINSQATRLLPHHRVWSCSQRLAILSRQSHAGALAIARFHRTNHSWSDPPLVVLGPVTASPQGTSLDLLDTCTPVPDNPSSHLQ